MTHPQDELAAVDLGAPRLRLISLGAGVQSTTMALMAAHGEIGPMPDGAIFSDVGDEPAPVYEHLRWLTSANVLPFPVHVAGRGTLSTAVLAGDKAARTPLFVRMGGKLGMINRQCTRDFKVRPIREKTRELLGVGPRSYIAPHSVEAWVGISTDEIFRVRPSGIRYIVNRHPLIELRMSRRDCLAWLKANGYPTPPKSSCWHCPYRSDDQWRDQRDHQPEEWAKAVAFDRAVRSPDLVKLYGAEGYVHRSGVPLDEADLSTAEDRGQLNLFLNDCEGVCGV